VRTFHVGRILDCELTKDRYQTPPRFSLEKYLGNAWRLIRDRNQSVHVLIRFQPLVAQNVAEVVWHKTQELHWNDDGTLDFRAHVEGIQEISWWVLGYGDQAEVLAPKSLRDLVAERVRNMGTLYGLLPRTRAKPRRSAASTAPVRRSAARRTQPR
jgi:proteasome accessory factor B